MKIIISIACIGLINLILAQENLVPNGGFNNTYYSGGSTDPVTFYTANSNCKEGRELFEADVQPWKVAKTNDSIKIKKESSFLNPGWKKHNHIVDFVFTPGVFFFDSYDGALGYEYLYNTTWEYAIKFGLRFGIWGRKSRDDLPFIQHRNYFNYSFHGVVNFPLWKSFSLEVETGVLNELFWPKSGNIVDEKGLKPGSIFFNQKIGLNSMFLSHFGLEFGINILNDSKIKSWHLSHYIGVAFKF